MDLTRGGRGGEHGVDPRWSYVIQKDKAQPRREERKKGLIHLLKPTEALQREEEGVRPTSLFLHSSEG